MADLNAVPVADLATNSQGDPDTAQQAHGSDACGRPIDVSHAFKVQLRQFHSMRSVGEPGEQVVLGPGRLRSFKNPPSKFSDTTGGPIAVSRVVMEALQGVSAALNLAQEDPALGAYYAQAAADSDMPLATGSLPDEFAKDAAARVACKKWGNFELMHRLVVLDDAPPSPPTNNKPRWLLRRGDASPRTAGETTGTAPNRTASQPQLSLPPGHGTQPPSTSAIDAGALGQPLSAAGGIHPEGGDRQNLSCGLGAGAGAAGGSAPGAARRLGTEEVGFRSRLDADRATADANRASDTGAEAAGLSVTQKFAVGSASAGSPARRGGEAPGWTGGEAGAWLGAESTGGRGGAHADGAGRAGRRRAQDAAGMGGPTGALDGAPSSPSRSAPHAAAAAGPRFAKTEPSSPLFHTNLSFPIRQARPRLPPPGPGPAHPHPPCLHPNCGASDCPGDNTCPHCPGAGAGCPCDLIFSAQGWTSVGEAAARKLPAPFDIRRQRKLLEHVTHVLDLSPPRANPDRERGGGRDADGSPPPRVPWGPRPVRASVAAVAIDVEGLRRRCRPCTPPGAARGLCVGGVSARRLYASASQVAVGFGAEDGSCVKGAHEGGAIDWLLDGRDGDEGYAGGSDEDYAGGCDEDDAGGSGGGVGHRPDTCTAWLAIGDVGHGTGASRPPVEEVGGSGGGSVGGGLRWSVELSDKGSSSFRSAGGTDRDGQSLGQSADGIGYRRCPASKDGEGGVGAHLVTGPREEGGHSHLECGETGPLSPGEVWGGAASSVRSQAGRGVWWEGVVGMAPGAATGGPLSPRAPQRHKSEGASLGRRVQAGPTPAPPAATAAPAPLVCLDSRQPPAVHNVQTAHTPGEEGPQLRLPKQREWQLAARPAADPAPVALPALPGRWGHQHPRPGVPGRALASAATHPHLVGSAPASPLQVGAGARGQASEGPLAGYGAGDNADDDGCEMRGWALTSIGFGSPAVRRELPGHARAGGGAGMGAGARVLPDPLQLAGLGGGDFRQKVLIGRLARLLPGGEAAAAGEEAGVARSYHSAPNLELGFDVEELIRASGTARPPTCGAGQAQGRSDRVGVVGVASRMRRAVLPHIAGAGKLPGPTGL